MIEKTPPGHYRHLHEKYISKNKNDFAEAYTPIILPKHVEVLNTDHLKLKIFGIKYKNCKNKKVPSKSLTHSASYQATKKQRNKKLNYEIVQLQRGSRTSGEIVYYHNHPHSNQY